MRIQHRYLDVLYIALPNIFCFGTITTLAAGTLLDFLALFSDALILLNCTLFGYSKGCHALGTLVITLFLFAFGFFGYDQILLFFQCKLLIIGILILNFASLARALQYFGGLHGLSLAFF